MIGLISLFISSLILFGCDNTLNESNQEIPQNDFNNTISPEYISPPAITDPVPSNEPLDPDTYNLTPLLSTKKYFTAKIWDKRR